MNTRRLFVRYHALLLLVLTAMNSIGMIILLIVFMNIRAENIQQTSNSMSYFPAPSYMDSTTEKLLKSQTPVNIHIYSINAYSIPENGKYSTVSKPMNHILLFENVFCCPDSNELKSIGSKLSNLPGITTESLNEISTTSVEETTETPEDEDENSIEVSESSSTRSPTRASSSRYFDSTVDSKISEETEKSKEIENDSGIFKTKSSEIFAVSTTSNPFESQNSRYNKPFTTNQSKSAHSYGGKMSIKVETSSRASYSKSQSFQQNPKYDYSKPSSLLSSNPPNPARPKQIFKQQEKKNDGFSQSPFSLEIIPSVQDDNKEYFEEVSNPGPPSEANLSKGDFFDTTFIKSLKFIPLRTTITPPDSLARTLSKTKVISPPSSVPPGYQTPIASPSDITSNWPEPEYLTNYYQTIQSKKLVSRSTTGNKDNDSPITKFLEDEVKHSSEHMNKNKTSQILIDCNSASNSQEGHKCDAWKKAGYCDSHAATRYIFCRKTCLCNFAPNDGEDSDVDE